MKDSVCDQGPSPSPSTHPHPSCPQLMALNSELGVKTPRNPDTSPGALIVEIYQTLLVSRTSLFIPECTNRSFPGGSDGKESAYNSGDTDSIPSWEDHLEKRMATHSSTLAWRIPWTEGSGGLQSMGLQRVGHS